MNQAQATQPDEARIAYVEPELSEEPKTNPRIRLPVPLDPEQSGVMPRMRAGVVEAQRALSRLRFAPAVVIGALLGSAPYLVQEHARARSVEPRIVAHELPARELETSQLAAAAVPAVLPAPPAPAPQPPPAVVEFDEDEAMDTPPARSSRVSIERAALQRARTLLRNGDAIGAQLILERLAQRMPHGSLVQQRRLLEIKVLYVLGGKSAAQRAAADFARAYPHSKQLPHLAGLLL